VSPKNSNRSPLPDILAPGLDIVFCGINPGLHSAAVGHHFAHPSNRFWKALHQSGFTPYLLDPSRDRQLTRYGIGLTNLVARPSAAAKELSNQELIQGRKDLETKIQRLQPQVLAFLGLGAYRKAYQQPGSTVGPQPDSIGSSRIWLLPNPSGLNAHYNIQDLSDLFRQLRLSLESSQP
jgi:TDG/mug DNA glycosylase family protein